MKHLSTRLTSLFVVTALLCGCAATNNSRDIAQISNAYHQGQYARAYQMAVPVARSYDSSSRAIASYYAGLSAEKLNKLNEASSYLLRATRSNDQGLSADAAAALGLVYSKLGDYKAATNAFYLAATKMTGEAQAKALLYEAIAQQKLGQFSKARANLVIARSLSRSASLKRKINSQMAITGYTIQVGAFSDKSRAKKAAQKWAKKIKSMNLGLPRMVSSTNSSGKHMILVQIGRFSTYASARISRQQLNNNRTIIAPLAK